MVRRIPIRAKVAGALAVPLLGLAAAAATGVATNTDEAGNITRQAEFATASIGHSGLIGNLQNERNLALVEMLGLDGEIDLEVMDQAGARRQTDAATATLRRGMSGQSDALREDYAAALLALDGLADLRAQVDAASQNPGRRNREQAHEAFASYTSMISSFFTAHDRFSLLGDDPGLRQGDDLLHYSSHATDATARLIEMVLYHGTGPGGVDEPTEVADIARLERDVDKNNDVVRVEGTGDYLVPSDQLLANPKVVGLPEVVDEIIEEGGPVGPVELLEITPLGPSGGYPAFRDGVVDVLDARAKDLHDAANTRRRLYVGGALALIGLALAIAWSVSRSITRPLRDLSIKARQMATYRLPAAVEDILVAPAGEDLVMPEGEPIVVSARDEVADVAGAFNDVQRAAIGLAVEQAALRRNVAESYVNLGRRNQNLLGRLLDALGELEQAESDPRRLNQIHRLDHLATRIRRNADSLLVLSQAGPAPGMQAPVEIADVVRAALGEIENYERVLVRSLDPAMVLGSASADVAHLLAELIENGLRHSPPRELVEVSGRADRGGYTINIVDHGLGMSPEDIERANQRLAGAESFTVTPAKYLGHYVTAVLAARHGIKVELQGSVVVGIAARVDMPASLLTDGSFLAGSPARLPAAVAPDPMESDEAGVTPSPDEVRSAVALLRSRGVPARPAPTPSTARPTPAVAARAVNGSLWAQPAFPVGAPGTNGSGGATGTPGAPPVVVVPDEVTIGPGRPAPPPERTPSGLVRRVRGTQVPIGAASSQSPPPTDPGGADQAAPPSSAPIDGPEFHRFLTDLLGGVQRSLDGQARSVEAGDER